MAATGHSPSPPTTIRGKVFDLDLKDLPSPPLLVQQLDPSPCTQACPAGVNAKSYVSLIAAGKFQEALEVVRERNPLPGICGRVCTHPCEDFCTRKNIDAPVAICHLKRFLADYELAHPHTKPKKIPQTRQENVAIIGSGPAGLTAANDLIRQGYGVTIFEAAPRPGGMLVAGIPAFRLPREIVEYEINIIKRLGVKIKTRRPIRTSRALKKLLSNGFHAVFIAVGAHKGKKLHIPGEEELSGVLDCVEFLGKVNAGEDVSVGKKVVVIGGGNSAIDAARTALRLNTKEVHIVYRRSRKEMPAIPEEVIEAEKEGVQIHFLATPVRLMGKGSQVTGMECVKMKLGKPDESGRRRPIPIEGSEFVITADTIIPAISQQPDLPFIDQESGLTLTRWNTLEANDETLATTVPGIFAGGDVVTGPNTVIDAMAQGHRAARSIVQYLNGEPLSPETPLPLPLEYEIQVPDNRREPTQRATWPMQAAEQRRQNFEEVEGGFDEATAKAEAQRCLRCGPCYECHICVPECGKEIALFTPMNADEERWLRIPPENRLSILDQGPLPGQLRHNKAAWEIQLFGTTPTVRADYCRGCGDCVAVCEYQAPMLIPFGNETSVATIDPLLCRSCGTCVAVCSPNAIIPRYHTSDWYRQKLEKVDEEKTNIVVFSCHWNGAVFNGHSGKGLALPDANIIFVNYLCAGRIEPGAALTAFQKGAQAILLTSCEKESCHYQFGVHKAEENARKIKQLAYLLGISPAYIQYHQIPSGNTERFVNTVREFAAAVGKQEAQKVTAAKSTEKG